MRRVTSFELWMRAAFVLWFLGLTGCSTFPASKPLERTFPKYHQPDAWPERALKPFALSAEDRMGYPEPRPASTDQGEELLYSFVINNMPVKEGLRLFARAYDLNIVTDEDVLGILDVEFRNMPLDRALSLMLESLDYYWQEKDGVIRVRSQETRRFSVDYLRLVRSGASSSSATVSSSSVEGGGEGGGGSETEDAGSITIAQTDEIQFWSELESQLGTLLSPSGKIVVNRLSGTVQVSDQHAYVREVAEYIEHINRAIHRQVDIEVRILEVSLDDSRALGVDWSRVTQVLDDGKNLDFALDGIVRSPAGGFAPLSSVLTLDGVNVKDDGNTQISAVVQALEQQGEVEIVSQPHVRTMNNQTSLIKVGTDRTFFRREQTTDSTSAGSISTATDVPQVVTEGVVLAITPQIGENGWVMMDVSPVVTRVSSVSVVQNQAGIVQSSAPNLDVAQVSSLV